MRTVGKTLLAALLLVGTAVAAAAQRFTVGTDGMGWLALGTVNADASVAVSRTVSLHAGAALNPWTYRKDNPDKQLQLRQLTVWGGARWWPWHVYSGWWAGMDARYMVYNAGGIIKREHRLFLPQLRRHPGARRQSVCASRRTGGYPIDFLR